MLVSTLHHVAYFCQARWASEQGTPIGAHFPLMVTGTPCVWVSPLNAPDASRTATSLTRMPILAAVSPRATLSGAGSHDCGSTLTLLKGIRVLAVCGCRYGTRLLCSEASAWSKSHQLCGLQLLHLLIEGECFYPFPECFFILFLIYNLHSVTDTNFKRAA